MKHTSRSKVHSPAFISINFHKELWKHIICQLAQIRIAPSRQFARWKMLILSSEPSCQGSPWGSFAALRQIGGNHSRTTTENPILYTSSYWKEPGRRHFQSCWHFLSVICLQRGNRKYRFQSQGPCARLVYAQLVAYRWQYRYVFFFLHISDRFY